MIVALVTGASGFIAQHVASVLRQHAQMRVLGLDVREVPGSFFDEHHTVDLTDGAATQRVVERTLPDVVYHLVGGIRGSDDCIYDSNVDTTKNVLKALRQGCPAARIVLVGSAAEYGAVPLHAQPVSESFVGTPSGAYGKAKQQVSALGQTAAREFGQQVCVARPFNVIGPGVPDSLVTGAIVHRLRAALAGPPPRRIKIGTTGSIRDFIAVEDVADGLVRIADRGRPGEAYNLCSGLGHSIADVLDYLLGLAGEPVAVEHDDTLLRQGEVDAMIGSWGKAKRDLGWRPTIAFEASLQSAWAASDATATR